MSDQDRNTTPETLSDGDLDACSGGFEAWPAKWKGFSLNGKGNTPVAPAPHSATIIGGFKSMSGMD